MIEKLILFYYYSFFSFETPLCSRPSGICIVTGFSENKSLGWLILIPLFCFRSCVSPTKAKQAGWQALHLTVMKALKTFHILLYWKEQKTYPFLCEIDHLYKTTVQECKKSTSDWRALLKTSLFEPPILAWPQKMRKHFMNWQHFRLHCCEKKEKTNVHTAHSHN